ncbi:MAG: sigma-70 family RNA polymerase sigma factor [Clostridiales bacterium]|nr:sigma-70 family RNA polymerase sigma factor [Clostridiales bacterium]
MSIANEVLMYFRAAKKSMGDISLSETIETDGDGSTLCLMDVVCLEENTLERISQNELAAVVKNLVSELLDERESEIIRLRYGLGGEEPKTQREVAAICNISRSYVSRIEKKALEKLKTQLNPEHY